MLSPLFYGTVHILYINYDCICFFIISAQIFRGKYNDIQTDRFHFAVEPFYELGNYIPVVLRQWQCVDHNCGLDQVFIKSQGIL